MRSSTRLAGVLKPSTQWRPAEGIWDIAVVDANTIAVLTVLQNRRALYLLRLDCGPAEYKLRLLHHFDDETNVALSSDVGGREVRNVLLGASDTITFVRLNLAEVQLKLSSFRVTSPNTVHRWHFPNARNRLKFAREGDQFASAFFELNGIAGPFFQLQFVPLSPHIPH
ncbi:hypothetical protein M3Y99_01250600 [Aphelenchoides fujianensis]|nr:hypothetical protein M3Y99_01250600 [Aphelenchoides fujianensis]